MRKVTVFKKEGRRSPWGVRYWKCKGKPVVRFFRILVEAEIYASELRKQFKAHAAGNGDLPTTNRDSFTALWKKFYDANKNRGLRQQTVANYNYQGKQVSSWFGTAPYDSFTGDDIKNIIEAKTVSVTGQKKAWMFIKRFYQNIGKTAPNINWNWPIEDEEEVVFCEPEYVEAVLKHVPERLYAAYALMFFAGIRVHEAIRMTENNINRIDKTIRIPASAAKKRRTRVLENLPQNLWDILATHKLHPGLTLSIINKHRLAFTEDTGIKWIMNGARHSFATYHVAWKGYNGERALNLFETADILGHKNGLDLLNTHYRGITDSETAARYFNIGLKEKADFLQPAA